MFLIVMLACGEAPPTSSEGLGDGTDSGFGGGDETPPLITFEAPEEAQPSGEDVVLEATLVDNEGGSGLFVGTLYYRNETDASTAWKPIGFVRQGESDVFHATIKASEQRSSGMWYYLQAIDVAQNESVAPESAPDSSYHFRYTD